MDDHDLSIDTYEQIDELGITTAQNITNLNTNLTDENNILSTKIDNLEIEKIMRIMKTLISIDTSIPPGNTYRQYIDAISPYFKNLGYNLEEVIVPEELIKQIPYPLEGIRINLVATKDFKQDKDISFYGHMDVVPAPEDGKEKWHFHHFEATMIDNVKSYGR